MGNDMWDVAIDRRYTKLVEKLLMLSSISGIDDLNVRLLGFQLT